MKKYIDLDDVRKDPVKQFVDSTAIMMDFLENRVPAADVAPVVHGEWIMVFDANETHENRKPKCSVCGEYHLTYWSDHAKCKYCPNCGAKMEEQHA